MSCIVKRVTLSCDCNRLPALGDCSPMVVNMVHACEGFRYHFSCLDLQLNYVTLCAEGLHFIAEAIFASSVQMAPFFLGLTS